MPSEAWSFRLEGRQHVVVSAPARSIVIDTARAPLRPDALLLPRVQCVLADYLADHPDIVWLEWELVEEVLRRAGLDVAALVRAYPA